MKKSKTPTSKKLIWFLFLNCTVIECIVIMVTFINLKLSFLTGISSDLTPLVTLVGAVIGESIGYAIYSLKSAKENSIGGITYDMAMQNLHIQELNNNTDNDNDYPVG